MNDIEFNGNYIQNQFCSYEIALKLKKLGFDEKCFGMYGSEFEFVVDESSWRYAQISKDVLQAPTYQQVIDWFRKNFNLSISIQYFLNDYYCYTINDMKNTKESNKLFTEFESYEEAREQAILKCIELLKNK